MILAMMAIDTTKCQIRELGNSLIVNTHVTSVQYFSVTSGEPIGSTKLGKHRLKFDALLRLFSLASRKLAPFAGISSSDIHLSNSRWIAVAR